MNSIWFKARSTARAVLLLSTLWMASFLASCGGGSEATPEPAALEELSWSSREGATRYGIRAWEGTRLLFETESSDTTLVFTPSLVHAWGSAGEIRVSIRAYARGEEIDRWDLKPLRGGAPKVKP